MSAMPGMAGCMGGMGMAGMDGMSSMGMPMGNMPMGNMGMGCMPGMASMPGGDGSSAMGAGNARTTNGLLGESSFEILRSALRMIPGTVSEDPRGFSLRCAVPNRL